MQGPLQELETTYFALQSQINTLAAACQSQDQRNALSTQYVQARQNYWACINKAFHDDDPAVATLTNQIDTANQQIQSATQEMGDIAKVINDITNVVNLGTQLAAKVITL